MSFNEKIKKEVRRRTGFACCGCQKNSFSLEIHHIISQEDGGPSTIDNAAPLCPTCHSDFGNNTEKRKRVKEMRDWWYETVEKMYKPRDFALLESISKDITDVNNNLPEIKKTLNEFVSLKINEITPQNAQMAVSSIVSTAVAGGIELADSSAPYSFTNFKCQRCGYNGNIPISDPSGKNDECPRMP